MTNALIVVELVQEHLNRTLGTHYLYDNPYLDLGEYRRILIVSPLSCATLRACVYCVYPDAPMALIDYPLFTAPEAGLMIGGRMAVAVGQMAKEPVLFTHLKVSRRLQVPVCYKFSPMLKYLSDETGISGALISYRYTQIVVAAI